MEVPGTGRIALRTRIHTGQVVRKKFSTASGSEYLVVSVQDTGVGMDEATRARIFEPFFTTKGLGKGTGLGLAVVYGVVNSHHAFVDVESKRGDGATFSIYFPVPARPVETTISQEGGIEKGTAHGNEMVLLVEDEEMLRELLKSVLEEKGYRVLGANDGQNGLETYQRHCKEIALVLSDMGLPRLGGWEMFQKMKEVNPNVRVILASGYFDPNLKLDMLKAGAKDFIQKPYVAEEVLKRIREVIDGN
jgi:two-component system cell cycle sensor histidine kinase/response regulator CckA